MNAVFAVFAVLAVAGATHVKREAVVSYVPAASPVVSYVAPNPVLARASRIFGEPGFVSRYVAAPVATPVATPVAAVETLDARYVAAPARYAVAAPVATVEAVTTPARLVSPYATSVASSSVVASGPSIVAAPARYSVLV